MDFTKEKKVLADQWSLGASNGLFLFGFSSGDESSAYGMFPAGAKTFYTQLTKMIEQYEKDNGPIDDSSSTVSHLSPMQQK